MIRMATLAILAALSLSLGGCMNGNEYQLRSVNAVTAAKTSSFVISGNQLNIKVWSPVDRFVGKVIDRVDFHGPNGESIGFNLTGAVQVVNIASGSVTMTAEQAQTVERLLQTKGTRVRVKLRIETFTYIVE